MSALKQNLEIFRNFVMKDSNNRDNLYLVNGFVKLIWALGKYVQYNFVKFSPNSHRYDVITNFIFFS